jgi:acetyl-CoA carboxylase biotin carboxylase subunit
MPMIRRILIANRGEIAVRVIRACREMGIETVAIYSEADADARHVALADRAVCIGPPSSRRSYLDMSAVAAVALGTGADAIHPGYGFLSENADFAALCEKQGITFIGPKSDSIRLSGDKVKAREAAARAGVPVVPGSNGAVDDAATAANIAGRVGFPILLKARGGGGGRGMRIVRDAHELTQAWYEASGEAAAAFGDSALYIERCLERVRHVEVQILADRDGRTIALGERDCSIQRRHQKIIEEGPCHVLSSEQRKRILDAAVHAAETIKYVGAGTVEFLFEPETGEFFFIEINARIQVEHPVTEMLTGVDLVVEQIRIAQGEPLSPSVTAASASGHAIECRVNAEDPDHGFAPCPGVLRRYLLPGGPGVRVDSHCFEGYVFPPHYDSLLAKVIVHGPDRAAAIARMKRALQEYAIEGISTTIPFHLSVLDDPDFQAGRVTTRFLEGKANGDARSMKAR